MKSTEFSMGSCQHTTNNSINNTPICRPDTINVTDEHHIDLAKTDGDGHFHALDIPYRSMQVMKFHLVLYDFNRALMIK